MNSSIFTFLFSHFEYGALWKNNNFEFLLDFTERCQQLLDKGEPEIYLHSLGAAIPRALNLALQIQKNNFDSVSLDTATSTVELTDDFEPIQADSGPHFQQSRYNSAVHIKIYPNPKVKVEVVEQTQEQ